MGFNGCIAYPNLASSLLIGIGNLDSTGSSGIVNVTMPNSLYRLRTATTGVPYFLRDYEAIERER